MPAMPPGILAEAESNGKRCVELCFSHGLSVDRLIGGMGSIFSVMLLATPLAVQAELSGFWGDGAYGESVLSHPTTLPEVN